MEAILKDPERISEAFRSVRSTLNCTSCSTAGKLTFSSDGNGRLRFCCSNKIEACRKSYSMKNMVLLLEQHSPGILLDVTSTRPTEDPQLKTVTPSDRITSKTINTQTASNSVPSLTIFTGVTTQALTTTNVNTQSNQSLPSSTILGQKRPLASPFNSPEAARIQQFKDIGNKNTSNHQIIHAQQVLIDQQASEISSLREELTNLSSHVAKLTQLINQSISNSTSTVNKTTTNQNLSIQPSPVQKHNIIQSATPIVVANNTTQPETTVNSPSNKKTYAQIASSRRLTGEDHQAAVKALEILCKRPRIKPSATNLHKVYVQGIARQPIKQLKTLFQSVRIRTSALVSISFVGLQTVEFLITGDYVNGFKRAIKDLSPVEGRFKILESYDPSTAADPKASADTKNNLQVAFVRRLHGIISSNPNKVARDYFNQWLSNLNLPLPSVANEGDESEEVYSENNNHEDEIIEEDMEGASDIATPEITSQPLPQLSPNSHQ